MIEETSGGFLISQIKQVSGRIFDRLLQSAGIEAFNGAQGRILYVLWQKDFVPIVELSNRTGLAKTTLTGMLDRMERTGLVIRVLDSRDRRQVNIVLTDQARKLSDKYEKVSAEMNRIFYAGFADEEILALERTLERILKNLNESEIKV